MKRPDFEALWNKEGSIRDNAPGWAKLRVNMRDAFPTYYSTGAEDPFAKMVGEAIPLRAVQAVAAKGLVEVVYG